MPASNITYDIDQLLELAATDANYKAINALWEELYEHPSESYLPAEKTFFEIQDFSVGMGNGFSCRIDSNYENGLLEFWQAQGALEQIGAPKTRALFQDVADLLQKMGVTKAVCQESDSYCLGYLDDFVDASHLLPDSYMERYRARDREEGEHPSLYEVFEFFDLTTRFNHRWWDLEPAEVYPALIAYLAENRDSLLRRKG
jgi:hypothetical protein